MRSTLLSSRSTHFFRLYNGVHPSGVRHIFHDMISQVSLSRDDVAFAVREIPVSLQICFLARGELSYHQDVNVPLVGPRRTCDPLLTPGLMLLTFMTVHLFQLLQLFPKVTHERRWFPWRLMWPLGKDFSRVTERVPPIFRSIEDNGSSAAISMKAGGSFRDAPCDPVAVAQPSITVPPCLDNEVCSYRDCSPKFASSCVPRRGSARGPAGTDEPTPFSITLLCDGLVPFVSSPMRRSRPS